jgi:hypothetical protein
MKTVSADKTYVDYTDGKFGVRVRQHVCQPIGLDGDVWNEYDTSYSVPVEVHFLELPKRGLDSITSLASNVAGYEQYRPGELEEDKSQLRRVLYGEISFDQAVSTQ